METKNADKNILVTLEKGSCAPDSDKLQHGLAKLVLALVQTVTDVLERQAIRKVNSGSLTAEEVERLGLAFFQIRDRTSDVAQKFGVKPEELTIKLSEQVYPGQVTIVDVVDKLIDQGTILAGDVTLAVAGIELATLRLIATLTAK